MQNCSNSTMLEDFKACFRSCHIILTEFKFRLWLGHSKIFILFLTFCLRNLIFSSTMASCLILWRAKHLLTITLPPQSFTVGCSFPLSCWFYTSCNGVHSCQTSSAFISHQSTENLFPRVSGSLICFSGKCERGPFFFWSSVTFTL